mgnify:CR=1 FL=1
MKNILTVILLVVILASIPLGLVLTINRKK